MGNNISYGNPIASVFSVALSTVPALLSAGGVSSTVAARSYIEAVSTLAWSIVASSTVASSTAGYPLASGVVFKPGPAMWTGPLWGIAPVGTAPVVYGFSF